MFWEYVGREVDPDSNVQWFLGTLGENSCFARALYFPPPNTAICSETKTVPPMQPAPACQPLASVVDHNGTVKVGCMLKRRGLIYPAILSVPESPQVHLCT